MDLTLQDTDDRVPADVRAAVRGRLLSEFASGAEVPGAGELEGRVEEALLSDGYLWPRRVVRALAGELSDELFGLGPLEKLMRDPEISEIMVNGPDSVYVEKEGRLQQVDLSLGDSPRVLELVRRIIGPLNLRLDETSPMVDARLPDGSRLNAVIPPLSLCGPTVTIRRFRKRPFTVEELVEMGTLTPEIASFIRKAVAHRANIIISGGTSSGKTTLLNMLSSFIGEEERLITIEDAAELRIEHAHVVSLESRPANIEGRGEVTVRDLVRNALRMRPDRIIVGEVRGAEALDMLQAMNTGHPGSLSTAHANSPRDLLSRLETMVLMSDIDLDLSAIRRQIGSALDLIMHTERKADGRRALGRIISVSCTPDDDYDIEQLYESTPVQGAAGSNEARGGTS